MTSKIEPLGLDFDETGATGAAKGDLSNVTNEAFLALFNTLTDAQKQAMATALGVSGGGSGGPATWG